MNDRESLLREMRELEALRKSAEGKYRTIIRTASNGFWLVDVKGYFLDVNDAYCVMTGYGRDELLKMNISDVEASESPQEVAEHIGKVIRDGSDHFETRHRRKDGSVIDIEVNATYMDADGGQLFVFLSDITARKRTDERLRTLSSAVEQSLSPVIITDTNGNIEYVNPRFTEVTGYTLEEIAGRRPSILKSGVHPAAFYAGIWQTITSGKVWRGDICNRKKNGELYWELRTIAPVKDEKGQTTHYVSVQIEDTERKRAEAALKESEARYHMLHATALDGIIFADDTGVITDCNPSAEAIFGYTGVMKGMSLESLMPEGLRARHREGFSRFITTGEKRVQGRLLELEGLRKNGEVFPIELIINSFTVNGKVHFTGTIRDITDAKNVDKALKKSQDSLKRAQRIAHIGNWDWEIEENELFWSDEIYRIFGLEPQSFGATYEAFLSSVHPEDRDILKRAVHEALFLKKPYSIDHRIIRPDGTIRIVHEEAEVSFDGNRPIRMFGTVQDISEQKMLEEELLKTQKLESIGILAGGIAHEFNNIMTGVAANAFLIKTAMKDGNSVRSRAVSIERAVDRARELTGKLLTFSSGGAPIKSLVSIPDLLRSAAEPVFRNLPSKIEFAGCDDLPAVEVDQAQMKLVFQNLYLNAVQAMPEGGVVEVRSELVSLDSTGTENLPLPEGRYVRITVKDQGTGITAEDLRRIFDPFFTTKPEGSGLGLTICYSVLKRHGGLLTAFSEPEKGASFSVFIPLSGGTNSLGIASTDFVTEGDSAGTGRVLLMDDEALVRETVADTLSVFGYDVLPVRDGSEAVEAYAREKAQGRPFDLVILDLTIQGGMGGAEAMKRLMELDPSVKAIVSSGYANDLVMSDFEKYGFKGRLVKPYRITDLTGVVREVIG